MRLKYNIYDAFIYAYTKIEDIIILSTLIFEYYLRRAFQ